MHLIKRKLRRYNISNEILIFLQVKPSPINTKCLNVIIYLATLLFLHVIIPLASLGQFFFLLLSFWNIQTVSGVGRRGAVSQSGGSTFSAAELPLYA